MCIFQSEQVIKLMSWFHWKQRMATEFARAQTIGLSCVHGHDAGMLSEIHSKTIQHCRAEVSLAIDME